MPKLYIAEDGGETVYEIFEGEATLGRGAANSVQLADSHASKQHAVIRRLEGHWKAIDLESKNGTRINGHYRNQHWLSDGDTLAIGEAHVRFAAEGEPEGPPAGAATAAPASAVPAKPAPGKPAPARPAPAKPAPAKPVPARPAPAKPAPAAPVAATPAPPAPALPAAPAQPAQAAPARAPSRTPVAPAPSRSRGAAPARKRRAPRDDYYDDEYDDEGDLPPRRRKSNSGPIVIIGILAAAAFLVIMFAIFAGGSSHNLEVFRKADKMADRGQLEEALQYAEQNAEPDGKDYVRVLRGIEKWKKMLTAKKHGEFEKKAREYFDKQIYRHQAVTGRRRGGFRAKDAYADSEVAKLLQQFLLDYPQTAQAQTLIGDQTSDYKNLRDCMRENPQESLRSQDVWGKMKPSYEIDLAARKFGKVYSDLEYAKSAYALIMSSENYNELRKTLEMQVDEVLGAARRRFEEDSQRFGRYLSDGRRGSARKLLSDMKDSFGAIPDFSTRLKQLDDRL